MLEWLKEVGSFLAAIDWIRLVFSLLFTIVAVAAGIWYPGRILERHTNQPIARYVWYALGTLMLVMIYLTMYGYGFFWDSFRRNATKEDRAMQLVLPAKTVSSADVNLRPGLLSND